MNPLLTKTRRAPHRAATALSALALALTPVLLTTSCGNSKEASADTKEAPKESATTTPTPPPGVVVLSPDAPELKGMTIEPVKTIAAPSQEVTATARIEANPNRVAHAVVPAPGRITHLMVKLGDSVTQGQPLVAIESSAVTELESAWVQAGSMIRQAQLALSKSEADLSRISDLFDHQAVAQKDVLAAQNTVALNKTSVEQAEATRDQARRRLELLGLKTGEFQQQIVVNAPISGKVMELSVVEGEYRNEINAPLVTISDLSRVWATSEVPESEIRNCKIGGIVDLELISFPNETFHARVTRIADTVNSDTRTIKVSAELENPGGRLRPEMFGKLRYDNGTVPTPWVPTSAVVRIGSKDFVFVEQEKGRFLSTPVDLGEPTAGGFPINSGIKAGDRVVTQGSIYLKAAL